MKKVVITLYCLITAATALADGELFTNITGSPNNSQGKLSYSVPLVFPGSVHGLSPSFSAVYTQGSGLGSLGVSTHLSGLTAITRCEEKVLQGSGRPIGGIATNELATYCLDGSQLIQDSSSSYRPVAQPKTKIEFEGEYESPTSWTVYDQQGYILEYKVQNTDVKEHNKVWKVTSKQDRFGNSIEYFYDDASYELTRVTYPGLQIDFDYLSWKSGHVLYSKGTEITRDNIIERIRLSKKNGQALYSYRFRYEDYAGFQGFSTKRLKGIKKCNQTSEADQCSRELTLDYHEFEGSSRYQGRYSDSTTAIDKELLNHHQNTNTEEYTPANFATVDIDNQNGDDICFYSNRDQLICATAKFDGGYAIKTHYDNKQGFGFNESDYKYYTSVRYVDLDGDLYPEICIADEDKLRCGKNIHGEFDTPQLISENLNYETGIMMVDINRDGKIDICGIHDETELQCYANNGDLNFSDTPFFTDIDNYTTHLVSELSDPKKEKSERYKKASPQFIDVTGDQVPDFCFYNKTDLVCKEGYFNRSGVYAFSDSEYQMALYDHVPEHLMHHPPKVMRRNGLQVDRVAIKSRLSQFKPIKDTNESITISMRFADINSDGLLDVCYVKGAGIYCAMNSEIGFKEVKNVLSLQKIVKDYDVDNQQRVYSSIQFADHNSDGISDVCLVDQQSQYCAFGNGHSYSEFEVTLRTVADTSVITSDDRQSANAIRTLIVGRTHILSFSALNITGNKVLTGDNNGDGRVETCLRTIRGLECIDNSQQNFYALLSQVTDSHGNATRFTYKNAKQTLAGKHVYTSTGKVPESLISNSVNSLLLAQMEIDTGLGESGSNFENVTYTYSDLYKDKRTYKSSFRAITQRSDIDGSTLQKEQVTEYYLSSDLMGRVHKVTEKINDVTVSIATNKYKVATLYGIDDIRLTEMEKTVYDPEGHTTAIRRNTERFSGYDEHGYPKTKIEIKVLPQGTESKQTTTTTEYDHKPEQWIMGRPKKQTVNHVLLGQKYSTNETQEKSVSFEYDPYTGALRKQIFEKGTEYEKTVNMQYYVNGLKKSESIVALKDEENIQTRTASYTYNQYGQPLTLTSALGYTTRTEYHPTCIAPENEYDIANRLVVHYVYDIATCRLQRKELITGEVESYSTNWADNQPVMARYGALSENHAHIVTLVESNLGKKIWKYQDRQGRNIKTVKLVSQTDFGTTKTEEVSNYNNLGQVIAKTLPIRIQSGSRGEVSWVRFTYDTFGRSKATTAYAADDSIQSKSWRYSGLTTNETFYGKTKQIKVGVLGKPVYTSQYGKQIEYVYTATGEVKAVYQNADITSQTKIEYDEYGFKIKQTEAATGTYEYKYNGFGELYWQKDAEGGITRTHYDVVGRKKTVTSKDGTSEWIYHAKGHGIGQLHKAISADGITRQYEYENKGRVLDEYLYIDAYDQGPDNTKDQVNRTHYTYDGKGRLITKSHNHNAKDSNLVTPLNYQYDKTSNFQAVSIPAEKLKNYDFDHMKNQFDAAVAKVQIMNQQIETVQRRANYHAKRMAYYEARVQFYSNQEAATTFDTSIFDGAIAQHREAFNTHMQTFKLLTEKANSFGGLDAERKYIYKGKKNGQHTYAYRECTDWDTTAYIFKRCGQYTSGAFSIYDEDYNDLSQKTKNNKTCKIMSKENPPKGPQNYCPTGTYVGTYTAIVNKNPRNTSGTERTYIKCKVCTYDKQYNPYDIFSELAQRYKRLADSEKARLQLQEYYREARLNQKISVEADAARHIDTQGKVYKDVWVPISMGNGLITFIKVKVVESVIMARRDALVYYQERQQYYQQKHTEQQQSFEIEDAKLSNDKTNLQTDEEAKQKILDSIGRHFGLQNFEQGQDQQAALEDKDLIIWAALNRDINGKVKDELFGNGLMTRREINPNNKMVTNITSRFVTDKTLSNTDYIYTPEGNLDTKEDTQRNLVESYTYLDNQIDTWVLSKSNREIKRLDYSYDDYGNILGKQAGNTTHAYQDDNPYRLHSYNGDVVSYDKRGNAEYINGKTIEWTSFGKARHISKGQAKVHFHYDASHNRVIKTNSKGTTYYISPDYEVLRQRNGDKIHRFHIRNGYEVVSTIERFEYAQKQPEDANELRIYDRVAYYSRDIVGSGQIVTGAKGQIISERHYTPFGEEVELNPALEGMSNLVTSKGASANLTISQEGIALHQKLVVAASQQLESEGVSLNQTKDLLGKALFVGNSLDLLRGFTSHEELKDVGLVHMNARLYDPELARFASADSIVPDAGNPLAFNRYAYVYNNPGLTSDPTGNWGWVAAAAVYFIATQAYSDQMFHQITSRVLLTAATANYGAAEGWSAGLTAGGSSLAMNAAASGKIGATEIRGAILASVSAEMAQTIGHGNAGGPLSDDLWTTAAYHGLAQGTIGWVRNKDFWTGFTSGFVGHAAGGSIHMPKGPSWGAIASRTMLTSSVAMITAAATGGDGVQAALTAAIVHLYNSEGLGSGAQEGGDPDIGGYSPLPTEYLTADGEFNILHVNAFGHLHDGDGTFYSYDSLSGVASPLESGAVEPVCFSCYAMGGTAALKLTSSAVRSSGYSVKFFRYENAGGGGVNLMRNGQRRFGVDYHKFKYNGVEKPRLHYHRGSTKSQLRKHRPYQGGW